MRRLLLWTALAVGGLLVAVAVTTAATSLTSQRVGLQAEPLDAGESLAPAGFPDVAATRTPRPERTPKREREPDATQERGGATVGSADPEPTATPQPTPAPTAAPEVEVDDDNSGSDSDSSDGDDSSGRGRGRGRSGDDD